MSASDLAQPIASFALAEEIINELHAKLKADAPSSAVRVKVDTWIAKKYSSP
jgi:hypothetical protein